MNDTAIRIITAKPGATHLFFLGQAGFVVKSGSGILLGIDLYLSNCVERVEGHIGYKRLIPSMLTPEELTFDYLIATHPHFDHFDMDAVPIMMSNGKTRLYASVNCEAEVKRLMMTNERITYVEAGDSTVMDDIKVQFVPCDHGTGAQDAVGVVIAVDGKTIYIAGDTCLRLDSAAELQKDFGAGLDVLIAPINGAYGNLNEGECVALSRALHPCLTIPCHYGMFASHGGNPGAFMERMNQELPQQKYLLMAPGEQLTL